LHALYAYARLVDEAGDSSPGDRLARLAELGDDLRRVWHGDREPEHPVLRRLAGTVAGRGLSEEPFTRLLQANVQDQRVCRYDTFDDLRGYCRLSADPVGRMVLEVFGQATPRTVEASDEVCTALQLLEHWQDVGEDRRAGRVYLPQQDLATWGVPETDLDADSASAALRELMRFEIGRAAAMLLGGARIVGMLRGWARLSVAGYVAGGLATVDALRDTGGDVLGRRSAPSRRRTVLRAAAVLAGRPAGAGR
jgi:squalene synthase HpnC